MKRPRISPTRQPLIAETRYPDLGFLPRYVVRRMRLLLTPESPQRLLPQICSATKSRPSPHKNLDKKYLPCVRQNFSLGREVPSDRCHLWYPHWTIDSLGILAPDREIDFEMWKLHL